MTSLSGFYRIGSCRRVFRTLSPTAIDSVSRTKTSEDGTSCRTSQEAKLWPTSRSLPKSAKGEQLLNNSTTRLESKDLTDLVKAICFSASASTRERWELLIRRSGRMRDIAVRKGISHFRYSWTSRNGSSCKGGMLREWHKHEGSVASSMQYWGNRQLHVSRG